MRLVAARIIPAVTQVTDRYLSKSFSRNFIKITSCIPYNDSLWVENHTGIEKLNASFVDKKLPIKYIDEIARFGRVQQ